jgi:L-fucose mutarotase
VLRGISRALSPELLKTIAEMGHGDIIVIADAFYPSESSAKRSGSKLVRADGVAACDLIEGVLELMPLDVSVQEAVTIMKLQECDEGKVKTPIWDEYTKLVEKFDKRGKQTISYLERYDFYSKAENAYAVVATGEQSLYGCIMFQKGTI